MPEKKNGKGIPQGIQGNVIPIFHMKIISKFFFIFQYFLECILQSHIINPLSSEGLSIPISI